MTSKHWTITVASNVGMCAITVLGFAGYRWSQGLTVICWFMVLAWLLKTYTDDVSRKKNHATSRGTTCVANPGIDCEGAEPEVTREQLIDAVRELTIQSHQLQDAVAYYQTLDDLRQREMVESSVHIRGWWCQRLIESRFPDTQGQLVCCDTFNGEEHSTRSDCRHCGQPKVNPNPRIDGIQTKRRQS